MTRYSTPIQHIRLDELLTAYVDYHYAVSKPHMIRRIHDEFSNRGLISSGIDAPTYTSLKNLIDLPCFTKHILALVLEQNGIDISENIMVRLAK